jgi:proteasome lid subunit RPN8/RPN11
MPQTKPMFIFNGTDMKDLNKQIQDIEHEFRVKEIDLTFKEERLIFTSIKSSQDAYNFVKEVIFEGVEIQEHFIVLYMNHANKVIGYYKHTKGTINSTQVDVEMIVAVGIKVLAKSVILSHNHPSGNKEPSQSDRELTKKVKQAFKYFDITVLDHIIATRNEYYSFADNSDSSLAGQKKADVNVAERELRNEILKQLKKVTKANSPNIWERIQTRDGYAKIEEQIIYRVVNQHMVPAAVIPMMETEMTMS